MNTLENSNCCKITYELVRKAMDGEPFTMQLAGNDGPIVEDAVSQGIDGHLEACFCPDRGDRFEWVGGKLHCVVSVKSLPTLLRRMFEMGDDDGEAHMLAEDMLRTLGVNEYGRLVGREAVGLD